MNTVPDNSAAADLISGERLDALADLCRRFHVRSLDIFGSAVTDRFDPARSDLDFLVDFEDAPGHVYFREYFGLREALQTLFGRPVDLLAEPSLENPYLRRQVESEKCRLFPPP